MSRCFFAEFAPEGLRRCDGPLHAHHVLTQQLLKREVPKPQRRYATDEELRGYARLIGSVLRDRRNLLHACARHHELFHAGRFGVPRSAVPAGVEAFAAEHGLVWELDRQFGLQEAA